MATQTGYISAPAGCNAAKVFNPNTDTVPANGTATSVTPGVTDPSHYTVVFTDLAAGNYRLVMYLGSDPVLAAAVTVTASTWTLAATGDASAANQTLILDSLEDLSNSIAGLGLIALETDPDVVTGMPETLTIGNDYVDAINTQIPIYIRDSTGTPITGVGSKNFSDADFAPAVVFDCGNPNNRVVATVTWVPPSGPAEGYLKVQIPSAQSNRAVPGSSVMQVTFNWTGITSVRSRQNVEWVERS